MAASSATTRMIWYRHWLELRIPVLLLCSASLGALLSIVVGAYAVGVYSATSGKLATKLAPFRDVFPSVNGSELIPLASHLVVAFWIALLAATMFAAGDLGALTGRSKASVHPSIYYTVSLPLSRSDQLLTRIAAALGSLAAVLVFALGVHVFALLILRQAVPLGGMAGTTLLAVGGGFGLIALIGFVTMLTSRALGGLSVVGLIAATWVAPDSWSRLRVFTFVAWTPASPSLLAGVAAASLALIAATLWLARRKDV
jgi:hypothetical protein